MGKYIEYKDEFEKTVNDFPMMFAFSNEQLEQGKKQLGVSDNKELLSIGDGGFIRKTDRQAYLDMVDDLKEKLQQGLFNDDEFLYEAFLYELGNHEYCITYDLTDMLDTLCLDEEQVRNNPRMNKILNTALDNYLGNVI